ncbi:MAG: DNA cytosine methyltransferase [Mycobacteriales bacterium]|nr:DNA cytosine methyltransferase [Mycobacteriales bacterium]
MTTEENENKASRLTAVDLFAGAGGATQGLRNAGFTVLGAVENDRSAATSYALNHPQVRLWTEDVRKVPATTMLRELSLKVGELTLLKACPPCQGFSSLAEGRAEVDEVQNDLVLDLGRFVRAFRPKMVLLENVPGLGRDARSRRLVTVLASLGYVSRQYRVNAQDFGVPQRRKRLIIVAGRGVKTELPTELSGVGLEGEAPATVRTAFDQLAQEIQEGDPLDRGRQLSGTVLDRVRAVPVNGSRFDLPEHLRLPCHNKLDEGWRSATGSYGRLRLDDAAPTMTTRCTTPACGSFIHPTEPRGITLREAATLQTFPSTYQFSGTYGEIERQIGNAVPVKMAAALGSAVLAVIGA